MTYSEHTERGAFITRKILKEAEQMNDALRQRIAELEAENKRLCAWLDEMLTERGNGVAVSPDDDTEEIPDVFTCDFCGDILETDQRRDMTDSRGNVVAWLCPRCMDNIPD